MIAKAQKLRHKVIVYATGNSESLLKYNDFYYSYENNAKNNNKEIIFHFPETPVNVKKLKVKAAKDVFPDKWEIQISEDNKIYETLKQSNEPFCKEKYKVSVNEKSFACSVMDTNIFEISNREDQHAHFVKFVMLSNTYLENDYYMNLITFYGFELIGDLYVKYKHCSHQRKSFINNFLLFFSLLFNSLC